MADGDAWVLEVVGRVVAHPEPLHDPPRRFVAGRGEGDDLVQTELLEAVRNRGPARLGRVAAAPVLAGEPPPDLHGGREVFLEARPGEPDEADEARPVRDLDRPQPPALLLELPADVLRERVALGARQGRHEMAHRLVVGVQGREGLEILLAPLPQQEALGAELGHAAMIGKARHRGVCASEAPGILRSVHAVPLSSIATFQGIHDFFHSTGFVVARNMAIILAVVFWLGLAFWVHKDARRRVEDPFLVFLATLVGLAPPYIGPVVYLLFRPAETLADARSRHVELQALEQQLMRTQPTCPVCSSAVERNYLACPVCTTPLRQQCARCHEPLEPLWQMCPYCTSPIEPSQVDLDAALTEEARTISLVDGSIPLVPQHERRVADA